MNSSYEVLEDEAAQVAKTTRLKAASDCQLLEEILSLIADGFEVAPEVARSDEIDAKMALYSHNLGTLRCCFLLSLQGYYTQSMSLLRCVYENWIADKFISSFPAKSAKWMDATSRPPSHQEMLDRIDRRVMSDETKRQAKEWYGLLCKFAHTDPLNLIHLMGSDGAYFGATYKPELFASNTYAASSFGVFVLCDLAAWIPVDHSWQPRCRNCIEKVMSLIDRENGTAASK